MSQVLCDIIFRVPIAEMSEEEIKWLDLAILTVLCEITKVEHKRILQLSIMRLDEE